MKENLEAYLVRKTRSDRNLDVFFIWSIYMSRVIEEAFFSDFSFLGGGITYYAFIPFLAYTIIKNPGGFSFIFSNTAIILLSLFIVSSYLIESFHDHSQYREVMRMFYMAISVPLFAVWIARDIRYLYPVVYSFLTYSMIHSLNVCMLNPAGLLESIASGSTRQYVADNSYFGSNLNGVGYMAGITITTVYLIRRNISTINKRSAATIVILISFYTLIICVSRSAYINFVLLLIVLMFKLQIRLRPVHYLAFLALITLAISTNTEGIQNLLFSRFEDISFNAEETNDSRSLLYIKLFSHVDEVFVSGVGEGGYYGEWGLNSDLVKREYNHEAGVTNEWVTPAHNSLFQILYYWGFFPLAVFILLIVAIYYYLPKNSKDTPALICYMLFFSIFYIIVFSNNFNNKDFSMIYGVIIGVYLNRQAKIRQGMSPKPFLPVAA